MTLLSSSSVKRSQAVVLLVSLSLTLSSSANASQVSSKAPNNPGAKAKQIAKPSAPSILSVVSSIKGNKVTLTITISLPQTNGGSKITGSKVTAGGKSCTMKNLKTSCKIKNIKKDSSFTVKASSKNKKGYGPKSQPILVVDAGNQDGFDWVTIPEMSKAHEEARIFEAVNFYASTLTCHAGGLEYHFSTSSGCTIYKSPLGGANTPGQPWPPNDWSKFVLGGQADSVSYVNLENLNLLLISDQSGELKRIIDEAVLCSQTQAIVINRFERSNWWLTKGIEERKNIVMQTYRFGPEYWPSS